MIKFNAYIYVPEWKKTISKDPELYLAVDMDTGEVKASRVFFIESAYKFGLISRVERNFLTENLDNIDTIYVTDNEEYK